MATGKSTVGPRLASRLGVPFVDTDAELERLTGRTVPDLWREEGEPAFRAREGALVESLLQGGHAPGDLVRGGHGDDAGDTPLRPRSRAGRHPDRVAREHRGARPRPGPSPEPRRGRRSRGAGARTARAARRGLRRVPPLAVDRRAGPGCGGRCRGGPSRAGSAGGAAGSAHLRDRRGHRHSLAIDGRDREARALVDRPGERLQRPAGARRSDRRRAPAAGDSHHTGHPAAGRVVQDPRERRDALGRGARRRGRPRGAGRRRRRRRRGRSRRLRGRMPSARRSIRPGPDDPALHGRFVGRGKDRVRPRRGEEPDRRLSPAGRRDRRPVAPEDAGRTRASGRPRRGREDRPRRRIFRSSTRWRRTLRPSPRACPRPSSPSFAPRSTPRFAS